MMPIAGRIHKMPVKKKKAKCASGPDCESCATATMVATSA